jgi:polysaccharide biosynthesis transport protein
MYAASATVLLNPDSSLVNGAGKAAADVQARFATSEAAVAHTPAVAAEALAEAGESGEITPGRLVASSSVSSDPNSNLLTFSVANRSKKTAVKLVNGYVSAFSAFSARQSTARIKSAIASETAQIAAVTRQITNAKKAHQSASALYAQLRSLLTQRSQDQASLTSVTASGGAQVTRLAQGAHQTQPDLRKNLLIGLAASIVLGIALVALREVFDSRIHTPEEVVAELSHLPLIGRLAAPPRSLANKDRLVMLSPSNGDQQQQFHKLRVSLDFANLKTRCVTMMVTSAVEQEGKSTTAANLAIALALTGRSVTLVDLDLRRSHIQKFFDLGDHPGITDVTVGGANLADALIPVVVGATIAPNAATNGQASHSGDAILRVIGSGTLPPNPAVFFETTQFAEVLGTIRDFSDVVVIDSAPLLPVADSMVLSHQVDGIVVVARVEVLNRSIVREMRRVLGTLQTAILGVVITDVDERAGYGDYKGYSPTAGQAPATTTRTHREEGVESDR